MASRPLAHFPRSLLTVPSLVVGGFFGLLLLLGIALHRDYGVSWDESENRENGAVNLKYVAQRLAPQLARQRSSYATIPASGRLPQQRPRGGV